MFGSIKRFFFLKKNGGISWGRVFTAILRRLKYTPHSIYYFFPFGFPLKNRKNIKKYRDIHKGRRCFIIANGPSLNKINFDELKDEITIGMNRIYLMEKENGFKSKYIVCVDIKTQLSQFRDEYDQVDVKCFYDWGSQCNFSKSKNQMFILKKGSPSFSKNLINGFGNTTSVTYAAIQLAHFMGCTEVYIIGKDHFYNTQADAFKDLISDGKESNHFINGYYKAGMIWTAPDYKSEEYAYSIARKIYEADNRIIKDATIGGKLQIFEKIDFYSLFNPKKEK
jgi:hypothetical protein